VLTPEHLDSLESLLDQIDQDGLDFIDEEPEEEEAFPQPANMPNQPLFATMGMSTSSTTGDYDDEVYVTVTKYRNWEDPVNGTGRFRGDFYVDLTFELNKEQDKVVSFSYELMEGTLGLLPEETT